MNVFAVHVSLDALTDIDRMFQETMARTAETIEGFMGMMGLIDDTTGEVLSIALNEREEGALSAREHESNRREVERYSRFFTTEPTRELYRLDARYIPNNRPFPGQTAMYARSTTGWVKPRDVESTISSSRDSLLYSAILEPGCAGFLLGSHSASGKILGFSMWQSLEHMLQSESERGYYLREMAQFERAMLRPTIRKHYRIFARRFAP